MPLPYNRWTDEQIASRNVSSEGDYPFTIIGAVLKKTKPGYDANGQPKKIYDMLEVDFEFIDLNGVVKKQKDWIVFIENMDWKLRHLANTTGLLELYDDDVLDESHLLKAKGVFTLGLKEMTDRDGQTKKVNFVKDYVKKSTSPASGFIDDDISL